MTKIMSTVNQKIRIVLFGNSLVKFKIRAVSIHRKESLSNNNDGIIWVSFSGLFQHPRHLLMIQMLKSLDVPGCRNGSFLKTVVWDVVHHDMIPGLDESVENAKTSHPSRRIDEHVHTPVFFQLFLKLKVEAGYDEIYLCEPSPRGELPDAIPYFWIASIAAFLALGCWAIPR